MPPQPIFVYGTQVPSGTERPAAHRLLLEALRQEYGLSVLPEIAREPEGKPYFPDRPDICFNISHSRGAAVCALHNHPVGIDVERLRPAPKRLAQGMADEAFFRLWTAKEATIKLQGRGIAALIRPLEPDPRCQCLENFLPGWIVTLCPAVEAPVCIRKIDG